MSVSINAVKVEDEVESKRLIRLALLSDALPFSFIDTSQNIERFYNFDVRPAILNQDPVLFCNVDGKNVGMSCVSTCISKIYELQEPLAIGVFTFVQESFRKRGLAYQMHLKALDMLKKAGYNKVVGEIMNKNQESLNSCNYLSQETGIDFNIYSTRYECKI